MSGGPFWHLAWHLQWTLQYIPFFEQLQDVHRCLLIWCWCHIRDDWINRSSIYMETIIFLVQRCFKAFPSINLVVDS